MFGNAERVWNPMQTPKSRTARIKVLSQDWINRRQEKAKGVPVFEESKESLFTTATPFAEMETRATIAWFSQLDSLAK